MNWKMFESKHLRSHLAKLFRLSIALISNYDVNLSLLRSNKIKFLNESNFHSKLALETNNGIEFSTH